MPKDRTTLSQTTPDRRDPTFVCALYAPDRRQPNTNANSNQPKEAKPCPATPTPYI